MSTQLSWQEVVTSTSDDTEAVAAALAARLADVAATTTADGYKSQDDILFFNQPAPLWLPVLPGQFAVFFPEDAHAPLANAGVAVHKLILKVAVE